MNELRVAFWAFKGRGPLLTTQKFIRAALIVRVDLDLGLARRSTPALSENISISYHDTKSNDLAIYPLRNTKPLPPAQKRFCLVFRQLILVHSKENYGVPATAACQHKNFDASGSSLTPKTKPPKAKKENPFFI